MSLDNKTILLDTTVIHPTAPSYININQSFTKHTLGAAKHKAQQKRNKYQQMLRDASQADIVNNNNNNNNYN